MQQELAPIGSSKIMPVQDQTHNDQMNYGQAPMTMAPPVQPMMAQVNPPAMPSTYPPTTDQAGLTVTGAVELHSMAIPAAPPMPPPITV